MMQNLALVTGGTRGIGAAISIKLRDEGYKVIANYHLNDDIALKFSDKTKIEVRKWDVSDYEQCKYYTEKIEKDLKSTVSILINNAGITKDVMFHKMSYQNWHDIINCNLNSCYNMCSAVYPKMRQNEFGRIINISSVNALSGQLGQVNYCASKAAIIGFTKSLAKECASKNITVNVIAPGYIKTDILEFIDQLILEKIIKSIPMNRLGEPNEIAEMVAFLISKKASFITGATFSINGGQYMQ